MSGPLLPPTSRIHVASTWAGGGCWERDRIVQSARLARRHAVVDRPEDADFVLLTDLGVVSAHMKLERRIFRLLLHPLLRAHGSRCFVHNECDIPRPYLPGVYYNLAWFPGVERFAESIVQSGFLQAPINPVKTDDPPPPDRDLLFSFVGRNSHPLRVALSEARWARKDVWIEDTTATFDAYAGGAADDAHRRSYVAVMRRSRWALAPRGWSAASPRLFEAMRLGIAPVVLCDDWLPPVGPDWRRCCLWLPEASVPDLPEILEVHGDQWRAMGLEARRAYREHFAPDRVFDGIGDALVRIRAARGDEPSPWEDRRRVVSELIAHWRELESPFMSRGRRPRDSAITSLGRFGT